MCIIWLKYRLIIYSIPIKYIHLWMNIFYKDGIYGVHVCIQYYEKILVYLEPKSQKSIRLYIKFRKKAKVSDILCRRCECYETNLSNRQSAKLDPLARPPDKYNLNGYPTQPSWSGSHLEVQSIFDYLS